FYRHGPDMEYDFALAPGADPRRIELQFPSARRVRVEDNGDLTIESEAGLTHQHAPVAYQETGGARRDVPIHYAVRSARNVGFAVGRYDASRPLVIDPVLVFGTYIDGKESTGADVAEDA